MHQFLRMREVVEQVDPLLCIAVVCGASPNLINETNMNANTFNTNGIFVF